MADLTAQQAILAAYINDMQRVLDNQETDPADHALQNSVWLNNGPEGSFEFALMLIPDIPAMPVREHRQWLDEDGLHGQITLGPTQGSAVIRFTNFARASITLHGGTDDDPQPLTLTDEQQEILDRYATAVSFWITGTVNGALTYADEEPDELDEADQEQLEIETEHTSLRYEIGLLANHCLQLAQEHSPDDTPNPAYLAAGYTLRKAAAQLARAQNEPHRARHYHLHNPNQFLAQAILTHDALNEFPQPTTEQPLANLQDLYQGFCCISRGSPGLNMEV